MDSKATSFHPTQTADVGMLGGRNEKISITRVLMKKISRAS